MRHILLLTALLATACQTDGPSDDDVHEATTTDPTATLSLDVGIAGGTLQHPLATVILPPNAFGNGSGTVTLTPHEAGPEGYDITGLGFTIDFGGQRLAKPAEILAHHQDDFQGASFLRLWSTFTGEHFAFDQMITDGEGKVKPGDFTLSRHEELTVLFADEGIHTQVFGAEPAELDILLVVSNDAVAEKQETFAVAAAELWDALAETPVDAHIGVIDMDTEEPIDGSFLSGQLMTWDGLSWVTPDTPQGADTLQDMIRIHERRYSGTSIRAFAATRAAFFARSSDTNVGFRRPHGFLELVFVADGDDESGSEPNAAELQTIMEGLVPSPARFRAHGVVGPESGNCSGDGGAAMAGSRFHRLVRNTGGITWSVCDLDYTLDFADDITADMAASSCVPFDHESVGGTFSLTDAGDPIDPVHIRVDDAAGCAWLTVGAYDDIDPAAQLLAHYRLGRPRR